MPDVMDPTTREVYQSLFKETFTREANPRIGNMLDQPLKTAFEDWENSLEHKSFKGAFKIIYLIF